MAKKGKFASKGSWSLVSWGTPPEQNKEKAPEPKPEKKQAPSVKPPEKAPAPKPEKKQEAPKKKEPKQKPQAAPAPKAEPKPLPPKAPELPKEEKPLTPLQKAWEITKTIFTYIIMAISVAMMIFTAISVSSFDRNDRDIFGYKAFIVRSDSMSATDFSAGDLVIIKEVAPSLLTEGDIIAFISEDPDSMGETFTHKIRRVETDEYGVRSFITYGTTTGVDDLYPVKESNLLGQYQFNIPKMGEFFAFMKTTPGYICCIFVPFILLLVINGGSVIASTRQIYKEKEEAAEADHQAKMEALTAQQAALEAQQQQMQAMMAQMMQLQAELKKQSED